VKNKFIQMSITKREKQIQSKVNNEAWKTIQAKSHWRNVKNKFKRNSMTKC